MQHKGNTTEAPLLVNRRHCIIVLENLFFIRPLLSRPGDLADFPNTYKNIQRGRQNMEKEKYVPNERLDKITASELKEMDISNMFDKEFTAMIINIFTELEKMCRGSQ